MEDDEIRKKKYYGLHLCSQPAGKAIVRNIFEGKLSV